WQQANGGPEHPTPAPSTNRSVAVIGSGPAGIGVAERLARLGHAVTIYEAWPEPGGVLRYGIPNFKLNKPAVERKFAELRSLGVGVRCSVRVGEDLSWDEVRASADAVFVGIGASDGAKLGIPGE